MLQWIRERIQGPPAGAHDADAGRACESEDGGCQPSPTEPAGVARGLPPIAGLLATDEEIDALFARFGQV